MNYVIDDAEDARLKRIENAAIQESEEQSSTKEILGISPSRKNVKKGSSRKVSKRKGVQTDAESNSPEEKAVKTKLPFEATIKAGEKEYVVEVREDGLKLVRWVKQ